MKIGFLGVGTIASCLIKGLTNTGEDHEFFIYDVNPQKCEEIAARCWNMTICESNQSVADKSDAVFLTMRADNCLDVLKNLIFRDNQEIINVIATVPPEEILGAIKVKDRFHHIIPLPSIRNRRGPIAAFPECPTLDKLLSPLGTVVYTKSLDEIRILQSITALMSSFYEMLHELTCFAENEGLGRQESIAYMSAFFSSLCENVTNSDFAELASEMTPGGLNAMVLKNLTDRNAIKAWAEVMNPVMNRIRPSSM